MSNPSLELLDVFKQATEGLQWRSESDSPFEVVYWQQPPTDRAELTVAKLLALTNHAATAIAETETPETFFAVATQPQAWHSPTDAAIVKQYQMLLKTLKQHLSNLTVYRVGDVNLDIYIIGETETGDLAGLATKAVETG